MRLLEQPTRLLFFTGKGGVGKTSLACATAVALADQGKNVLLVSTDPASNLGQVFGVTIGEHDPTAIPGVPGLYALNINPEAAAQAYRDRIVGPVRDVLPAETVKGMEEQLSGACTTEIAAFDEFTGLLTDGVATGKYDHVIFDTAPTGHTLRLLQLPTAWSNYLDSNESGASCLGPLSGLEKQRQQYAHAVAQLANGDMHDGCACLTPPEEHLWQKQIAPVMNWRLWASSTSNSSSMGSCQRTAATTLWPKRCGSGKRRQCSPCLRHSCHCHGIKCHSKPRNMVGVSRLAGFAFGKVGSVTCSAECGITSSSFLAAAVSN